MNILVTGGAGFIGSHTVVELFAAGHNPVIVDDFRASDRSVLKGLGKIIGHEVTAYEQDFSDIARLQKIIEDESIEGVIHFAAYKAVGESVADPLKYYDNNVAGFVRLLEILEKKKISNIVFSSSCTVYGEPDKLPITESTPQKPATSPYGATKQMCEEILRDATSASKNLKSIALRYFNPIGAHPSGLIGELPIGVPANLIPYLTQTVAGLRPELVVNGKDYPTPDGSCVRDYIHVVDLAKAHVQAIDYLSKQAATSYDVYNVGTGQGSSVLEVIETFESATGKKVPYKIGPRREGDIIATYASVDKIAQDLSWKAELSLETALKDAWRWQTAITEDEHN